MTNSQCDDDVSVIDKSDNLKRYEPCFKFLKENLFFSS